MVIFQISRYDVTGPVEADGRIRWAAPEDSRGLEAFGHEPDVLQRRFAAGARVCMLTERETTAAGLATVAQSQKA